MRLRRQDISQREQVMALESLDHGEEPMTILRSKLDESITIRLKIQRRVNVILVIALTALALAGWGFVRLQNTVHHNKGRIQVSEDAYCKIKATLRLFGESGTVLFQRAHLLRPGSETQVKIERSLKLLESIPSSRDCTPRS